MIPATEGQELGALPRPGSAPERLRTRHATVALTCVGVLCIALLVIGTMEVLPMTGSADPASAMGAPELAELALDSVQYLQTLTTAVFAGAMLLLSQKALGRLTRSDDSWARIAVACGFVFLVFSLAAGFLQIELITEAADQRVVDDKMENLRLLRAIQSGLLLAGVSVIGAPLLHDLVRGEGPVVS